MDFGQLTAKIDTLMPEIVADLKQLAAIPSIAFPGYPKESVIECRDRLVELLRDAGVHDLQDLNLADSPPIITGYLPPPAPRCTTTPRRWRWCRMPDAARQLHGPNERVLLSELRNSVLAEAAFFQAYADRRAKLSS